MLSKTIYFCLILIFCATAQQLSVNFVNPAQNSNIATPNVVIVLEFNIPINITYLDSQFVVQGSMFGKMPLQISTDSLHQNVTLIPQEDFLLGERINVIAKNSLLGANGELFDGYQWSFNIQPILQTPPYFTPPTIYGQFGGHYIETADIDHDHDIDLIFSSSILQNDGFGVFSHFQFLNSSGTGKPMIFDLDNDGYRNLWVYPFIYEQGVDYSFQYDTTIFEEIVAVKDMNNDGYPDFILNETDPTNTTINNLGIHYNYGKLVAITQLDTIITDSVITSVCTDDFNNDGIEDIAYCTSVFATPSGVGGHNSVRILYMDSSGHTLYRAVYNGDDYPFWTLGMPVSIKSADFNNDGFEDVFITSNGVDLVLFNNTIGGFSVNDPQFPGGGDLYHTAVIGDINGDGWLDLVYNYVIGANENASTSYMLNTNGQFNSGTYIYEKEMASVSNSAIADFTGDGSLDIASNWFNGLYVHFNSEVNNLEHSENNLVDKFVLTSNYPNPFNMETTIDFFMPVRGVVESKIYDLNGKEVKVFTNEHCHPGWDRQKWNGKNNTGKEVSSGIYIWKFAFQGRNIAQKIILTK